MHSAFKIRDAEYNVELSRTSGGYCLHVDGTAIPVTLEQHGESLNVNGASSGIVTAVHGDTVFVHVDGETHALRYLHPLDRLVASSGGVAADQILAPMPGTVISVAVIAGAAVKTGATLMVIESMKMETTLAAPRDGVIAEVLAGVGDTFDRDSLLLALQPEAAA